MLTSRTSGSCSTPTCAFPKWRSRRSRVFGNVARLTSVYEFTWQSPTETRRGRGVNFFTLVLEGGRWRVMSIVWDNERPGLSLPPEVYPPRAAS